MLQKSPAVADILSPSVGVNLKVMGQKKDKHVAPGEWAKHFRKFWKRIYNKKSRQTGKKLSKEQ